MSENQKEQDKKITIIVNTREKPWIKNQEISYQQVVELAYGSYTDDENVVYTVTYSKGPESHHEGSMLKGDTAKVKDGMIFNVTQTNKS